MGSQDQSPPTAYPADWFPGVKRANAERERKQLFADLEQLPTGVIRAAVEEARKLQADNPLTQGGGAEGGAV